MSSLSAHANGRPMVLLVEDHLDTRDMYAWSLEASGFRVLTAAAADEAFDLATTMRPHIVVTDYVLQGGPSGADLCNRLKDDSRTAAIPTLMVTGSTQRQLAEGSLRGSCSVVRLKPYLPDALERDIVALIAGQQVESI
jgi:two-component system, OmpR family, phosphate regulon response regulator PhoB